MRIAIGQIFHETNTFSNNKTTKELFQQYEWLVENEIIEFHEGTRSYIGGMIDKALEEKVEIVPTFSADCNPSGIITKDTYDELKEHLISRLKKASKLDAICLSLHGAGISEDIDDLEGDLLKELRRIFGYAIPIVVSLDLHGNITETMAQESTALIGVKKYPHIDCYEIGKKAMDITIRTLKGEINPVNHMLKLPLIIPLTTTDQAVISKINQECQALETNEKLLDCTFFHGFYCTDIPHIGTSVVAVADGDEELAEKASTQIAAHVWSKKDEFYITYPSPTEGIAQVKEEEQTPVIINEMADNPGGGAPGDGTRLLKALLNANLLKSCFGFIYDPKMVERAHSSGVASYISGELGGKTDTLHGSPIHVNAYVKILTDGVFTHSTPMHQGKKANYGKTALIQIGNVDVIICSVRSQTHDEQIFLLHGIDVKDYKIVCLKSSQHFKARFNSIAKKIITVDSGGLSTSDIHWFNYKRINRPIYPLDLFDLNIPTVKC